MAWPSHPLLLRLRHPYKLAQWATVHYVGIRPLVELVRHLPRDHACRAGAAVGSAAYRIVRRDAAMARRNLQRAFPELPDAEIDRVARDSFSHLGRSVADWLSCTRMTPAQLRDLVPVVGLEHLERVRAEGRGVLLLSGHFDSWDKAGAVLGVRVPSFAAVAKPTYDRRLERLLRAWRGTFGVLTIQATDTRGMIRFLKDRGVLAILSDQSGRGVVNMMIPWFGHDAPTPVGQVRLAARTNAAVVTAFLCPRDGRDTVVIEPLADRVAEGDEAEVMRCFNERLARLATAHPERWVWLHDRYRPRGAVTQAGGKGQGAGG